MNEGIICLSIPSQETPQLEIFVSILIIKLVKNTLALLDSFNFPPSETV